MATAERQDVPAAFIGISGRQLIGTIGVGLGAGALSWGLAWVLDTYVLQAMMCQTMMTDQCAASDGYAATTATIIAAAGAIFLLVRLQVFRPLLVGLGPMISLWGLQTTVGEQPWFVAAGIFGGLFALAYLAFMWVARIRLFGLSVIVMIVLVVAVRLALNS